MRINISIGRKLARNNRKIMEFSFVKAPFRGENLLFDGYLYKENRKREIFNTINALSIVARAN